MNSLTRKNKNGISDVLGSRSAITSFLVLPFVISLLISCDSPGVRLDDLKSNDHQHDGDAEELSEELDDELIQLKLYGVFCDTHNDGDTLFYPQGKITLSNAKGLVKDIDFDEHGNYLVEMSFENEYEIRFESPNHYTKFLTIDSRGIPDSLIGSGYLMPTDMSLPRNENGLVKELLIQNPIGKAFMNATIGDFGWDWAYTDSLNAVIKDLESEN